MRSQVDPVRVLRDALEAGDDPLEALAGFRAAQALFHARYTARQPVSCTRGCSACCSQMVFDVAAVEVEDLGVHLRDVGREAEVAPRLRRRRDLYDRVKLENPREAGESREAWIERVALAFWALGEPCVFLDAGGACSVFEHRPQGCRRYFVHGPAELCDPQSAADPDRRARLVEPGSIDEVDALLATLSREVAFEPDDDRLDHALLRWLELRSRA